MRDTFAEWRTRLGERIAARIAQGVADGDLPADTDPAQLGSYLMAVLSGMSACARDGGGAVELQGIAEAAMTAIPHA